MKLKGQIQSIGYNHEKNETTFGLFGINNISAVLNGFINIQPAMVIDADVEIIDDDIYKILEADFYEVHGAPGNTFLEKELSINYKITTNTIQTKLAIEEMQEIENDLLRYLKERPELTRKVNPDLFEKIICELLNKSGFEAIWSGRNKSTGADILAYHNIPIIGIRNKYLVECKRYAENRPVGLEIIRSAYGALTDERGTGSIIVTTSRFESGAIKFIDDKWNMKLIDFEDLKKWMNEIIK